MKAKTNIWDIFKGNDGKWSLRAIMAFLLGTTFSVCGIADSSVKGVEVDPSFYWSSITLITALISVRALQYIAQIKTNKIVDNGNSTDTISAE